MQTPCRWLRPCAFPAPPAARSRPVLPALYSRRCAAASARSSRSVRPHPPAASRTPPPASAAAGPCPPAPRPVFCTLPPPCSAASLPKAPMRPCPWPAPDSWHSPDSPACRGCAVAQSFSGFRSGCRSPFRCRCPFCPRSSPPAAAATVPPLHPELFAAKPVAWHPCPLPSLQAHFRHPDTRTPSLTTGTVSAGSGGSLLLPPSPPAAQHLLCRGCRSWHPSPQYPAAHLLRLPPR